MPNYDENYYKSGNYLDYLDRRNVYRRLAKEVAVHIEEPILDFGCGVGFLVSAFEESGYVVQGYDVSDWAVQYGRTNFNANLTNNWQDCNGHYGTLLSLDVFEHMPIEDVETLITNCDFKSMLVRIPVAVQAGDDFFLEVSRNDATHITCLTKDQWQNLFVGCGFELKKVLDFESIWDSEGVMSRFYVKNRTS